MSGLGAGILCPPVPPSRKYAPLTPAWKPYRLAPIQAAYLTSPALVNYVAAGRRSFKTQAGKLRLVRAAIAKQQFDDPQYFACGPTWQQTKDIFWEPIKQLIPDWAFRHSRKRSISESELRIELRQNTLIRLAGLDKPQRVEGGFWDGGVITEYADVKEGVVKEHIDPMRIRGGWIDCEGVPEGRNHFYREVQDVKNFIREGDTDYAYFHWKTSDVLWLWLGVEGAAKFLATMKKKLDPLTFRQEFDADFVSMEGAAYYQFDEDIHVKRDLPYDKYEPLIFCFDFNVSPGVCAVAQEHKGRTNWIGEVYIERGSNTPMVCRKLANDWGDHRGEIHVYGDSTGGNGGSAKVDGSDWDLVQVELQRGFKKAESIDYKYAKANGPERARVNAMNTRLLTADGTVGMLFSQKGCPNLIRDMEGVKLVKGGSGEIDKKKDKMLTHLSDGAGYYIVERFPTTIRDGDMEEIDG